MGRNAEQPPSPAAVAQCALLIDLVVGAVWFGIWADYDMAENCDKKLQLWYDLILGALLFGLVCDVGRRLVHRTSFVVAVSRGDEAAVDEVLEASLQTSHDVAALRVTFRQAFAAHGGRSRADLRAVFDHFEASGDGELDRDDARALIKWVLKRRISKDHFDRVWRELNVDEIEFFDDVHQYLILSFVTLFCEVC